MGSQTLEILRQGVWASLTGGWFYDPHQDAFCNTFHLYVWLFLLCLPFFIHVYFPPMKFLWYFYCGSVATVLTVIKFVNYGLHHMYDTTECVQEVRDEDWQGKKRCREEEGIEMQVLSKGDPPRSAVVEYATEATETAPPLSTDADSVESNELQAVEVVKQGSTIDLKAEVHRKNSSESSEELATNNGVESAVDKKKSRYEKRSKHHQRSKTDGFVSITVEKPYKMYSQSSTESQNEGLCYRPSLQSVVSAHDNLEASSSERRHSNFACNSSLNFLPTGAVPAAEMKPTGSLELGFIDKTEPNLKDFISRNLTDYYFGGSGSRIRSSALETCWPPPSLAAHPNSLEIIGCKGIGMQQRNPLLPPPSASLIRNQHLNLSPYFGSEIVYPIAEQSDEHQTSHGPDTDVESAPLSDSDDLDEDQQPASHSPLIYIKMKKLKSVPYDARKRALEDEETNCSATSKDALLDHHSNENSSGGDGTPEMHDARTDCCYNTDNDNVSDKKQLSECSNLSCSSGELKPTTCDMKLVEEGAACALEPVDNSVQRRLAPRIVRKRNVKKNRRRKQMQDQNADSFEETKDHNASIVELDLDWLFEDESHRLPHRKEPLKKESDWTSTTTVSLEQDVSKVLQETVPVTRSLGAIPKKTRSSSNSSSSRTLRNTDRKTMAKIESDKCNVCRCKSESRSDSEEKNSSRNKENKVTQTLLQNEPPSPIEPAKFHRMNSGKRAKSSTSSRGSQQQQQQKVDEASSSGSNNELCTLLPYKDIGGPLPPPPPPPLQLQQNRPHLGRSRGQRRRSNHTNRRENAIASSLSAGLGTHSAKNFNDTSDGSIHCFIDEHGNWVTYTFDEKGLGTANGRLFDANLEKAVLRRRQSDSVTATPLNRNRNFEFGERPVIKARLHPNQHENLHLPQRRLWIARGGPLDTRRYHLQMAQLDHFNNSANSADEISTLNVAMICCDDDRPLKFPHPQALDSENNNNSFSKPKSYYKYRVLPWFYIKVTLDRLKLLALLDRNFTMSETLLSVVLGVLVSVLGAILLFLDFYQDLQALIFCFVIASCQYSLLKSVQPDAASPTHGFNRVIAYSRPIYFIVIASLTLLIHCHLVDDGAVIETGYSLNDLATFSTAQKLLALRDFLSTFILFFPLLFSLGLFPQINTFLMYLLEQIDMHVFGGNATSSLTASIYCIFRSILAVIVMNGFAYGALNEPKSSQHILFSMFCACLVACSYHLSRSASDPAHIWNLLKRHLWPPDIYREHVLNLENSSNLKPVDPKPEKPDNDKNESKSEKAENMKPANKDKTKEEEEENVDPLPAKLQKTVNARLKNDVILCSFIAILVFAIHASTVFTVLKPELSPVLWSLTGILGFILHYVIPQLRKLLPWLCIARPLLRSYEHEHYQTHGPAVIMWFEKIYVYFCFLERNIFYPLVFLSALTEDAPKISDRFGPILASFIVVICGLKCLRSSYSNQTSQYLILIFTALFLKFDYKYFEDTFLIDYFFISIVFHKCYELLLKLQFVVTYIAPWQITWGSAFHAFAQPFSVPHSAMLFLQAVISAILSTPLNPFLGSAIFLTSYVRPVKFWERDYNTRRVDHSNTPLSSHLDRNLGSDDNNLNSIFYEHLTRSLQHSLCGDLMLGRWGNVSQGDCFVLASDYLNCLVHIIEMGNGLITFQMRGLEFKGTYCQQREVEAITEGVEENDGCCCCDTGHLPNMLSVNAAFSQRWLAWEVTAAKYILEGYSISDNSAVSMLQVYEFRKVLVSYYVKSIIFYTIRSTKLEEWLSSQTILKALQPMDQSSFIDLDPVFNYNIDEDFDNSNSGMTRTSFMAVHGDWIAYCVERSKKNIDCSATSTVVLLCFALSLLGRRTLGAVSHNTVSSVEFFLYGLHALFKGDFRITCARDEWVFTDMDLLKTVVAPGVRMSLKLHQDHFMSPEDYEDQSALYDAICKHEEELVISHEGDPAWRTAVLSGTSSLLALRHVLLDGQDEYKIIMLNKRYLSFRVIKINKECVRGLWAGQQQELVYLRNRNPERGSIQNAKQALRNIINSSCDQPIGYPIYVSPLTTSYAETNEQLSSLIGGSVSLKKIRNYFFNLFRRIRKRCGEGCSSGASNREEIGMGHEGVYAMTPITALGHHTAGSQSTDGSHLGGSIGRGSSLSRASVGGNRGSLVSVGKPTSSTLASLAGLFKEKDERAVSQTPDAQSRGVDERLGDAHDNEKDYIASRVKIIDPNLVYDAINLGRRIDVSWPTEYMRIRGGRSHWKDWVPEAGMEGPVVHKWTPCNRDPNKRSHVDRTILLVQIDDRFVPIAESGVQDLGPEV